LIEKRFRILSERSHLRPARTVNSDEKDADASPYTDHPIALVSILAVEAGNNDCDTLCAALLHDAIEDTDTSVEELVEASVVRPPRWCRK
jgi:(p)ppGpp synthase/HD superfamily hydrolase